MCAGTVRYAPVKSVWFLAILTGVLVGGVMTFTWFAFAAFLLATATVLLFGHSLGSHRKLVHDSYQCPKWLEYLFVYLGVQVGLAGPIGLLRQRELRDYAQRSPNCSARAARQTRFREQHRRVGDNAESVPCLYDSSGAGVGPNTFSRDSPSAHNTVGNTVSTFCSVAIVSDRCQPDIDSDPQRTTTDFRVFVISYG